MAIDRFRGRYYFLSNFYPEPVSLEGQWCPTVEHAYQAAKTFDKKIRLQIISQKTPGYAKRLAKTIEVRPDWKSVKLEVMEGLLRQKFAADRLRLMLLETGAEPLIEGNTWGDRFWGVCDGYGKNHLGLLLMKIRAEITSQL